VSEVRRLSLLDAVIGPAPHRYGGAPERRGVGTKL
jgi:hypothetical protein